MSSLQKVNRRQLLNNISEKSSKLTKFGAGLLKLDLRAQFLAIVVLPTLCSALYYGVIASDRYVSHAAILVRSVNSHSIGSLAPC